MVPWVGSVRCRPCTTPRNGGLGHKIGDNRIRAFIGSTKIGINCTHVLGGKLLGTSTGLFVQWLKGEPNPCSVVTESILDRISHDIGCAPEAELDRISQIGRKSSRDHLAPPVAHDLSAAAVAVPSMETRNPTKKQNIA